VLGVAPSRGHLRSRRHAARSASQLSSGSFAINGAGLRRSPSGRSRTTTCEALIERDREGMAARGCSRARGRFGLPAALADSLRNDFRAEFASSCVLFPDALETRPRCVPRASSSD
jgi:hypothetical protein